MKRITKKTESYQKKNSSKSLEPGKKLSRVKSNPKTKEQVIPESNIEPVESDPLVKNKVPSTPLASGQKLVKTWVKVFDFILAGYTGLNVIFLLYGLLSQTTTKPWYWLAFYIGIIVGLVRHKSIDRVICIILITIDLVLTIVLFGLFISYS